MQNTKIQEQGWAKGGRGIAVSAQLASAFAHAVRRRILARPDSVGNGGPADVHQSDGSGRLLPTYATPYQ
jgi:hypothetical protein